MPYDATPVEIKPDLSEPSLEGLAWLLRHPEEWPEGHEWDFSHHLTGDGCGTTGCALGIAQRYWGRIAVPPGWFVNGGITALFVNPHARDGHWIPVEKIQPHHVAAAIERYLRTGEIYYDLEDN